MESPWCHHECDPRCCSDHSMCVRVCIIHESFYILLFLWFETFIMLWWKGRILKCRLWWMPYLVLISVFCQLSSSEGDLCNWSLSSPVQTGMLVDIVHVYCCPCGSVMCFETEVKRDLLYSGTRLLFTYIAYYVYDVCLPICEVLVFCAFQKWSVSYPSSRLFGVRFL